MSIGVVAAVIGAVWLVGSLDLAYSQDTEELGRVSEQAAFGLFGLEIRDWTYLARIAQGVFTVAAILVGGVSPGGTLIYSGTTRLT